VIALDGLSTQRFLANPSCYEINPIARPFVRSRFGSGAYFSSAIAGEVAAMCLVHKHHHHLLEHIYSCTGDWVKGLYGLSQLSFGPALQNGILERAKQQPHVLQ
jgi:hypothetical protein